MRKAKIANNSFFVKFVSPVVEILTPGVEGNKQPAASHCVHCVQRLMAWDQRDRDHAGKQRPRIDGPDAPKKLKASIPRWLQLKRGFALENKEIARLLWETADLMEIAAEDGFRIRSYRNGATAVEG